MIYRNRPAYRFLAAGLLPLLLAGCSLFQRAPAPPPPPPTAVVDPGPPRRDPEVLANQANALMLRGDNLPAAETLLRLVGEFPAFVKGWDLLAFACARLENPGAARAAAERAVTLQPDSATARFNAGLAQARMANYPRAIAHLTVAFATNRGQAEPGYYLGKVYEAAGQQVKARAVYDQTLALFPADADLRRAVAALSGDLNQDGQPERIDTQGSVIRVVDGATGAQLLRDDLGAQIQSVRVVDMLGPAPALLVTFTGGSAAYAADATGRLVPVGRPGPSPVYNLVNRALEQTMTVGDRSQSTRVQFRYGKLEVVARWSELRRDLVAPPGNALEAFGDMAAGRWSGMASEAVVADMRSRFTGSAESTDRLALLVPEPNGGFRLELLEDGKLVAIATAEVTGFRIQALTWR